MLISVTSACSTKEQEKHVLRIMVDAPPVTLNPRQTVDATGQRLAALMFRGLTRLDADLRPVPDLAESWAVSADGRTWSFRILPGQVDHAGRAILPAKIAQCLENYRIGTPISPYRAAFPYWVGTNLAGDQVQVTLSRPDPYLPRNLTALRYFSTPASASPCAEPLPSEPVVGSGPYRAASWDLAPTSEILLLAQDPSAPALRFMFGGDYNSRTLKIIRGDVDVTQTALSHNKERWLIETYPDRFRLLTRMGVNVSYLAFNLRDPILSHRDVRHAIAHAIPRQEIVTHKLKFCTLAGSFLSPLLPESHQISFGYNPAEAETLLDRAGFPRKGPNQIRFELKYKTTPVRDGFETALLIREALGKVGIRVTLDVVEPAVFLASMRKKDYQICSSRWIGVADGSILYQTLHSSRPNNRVGYINPEMDALLDQAMTELNEKKRQALWVDVQKKMMEDLPYFPLWYWNNTVLLRENLVGIEPDQISLSSGFGPLTRIRFKN